MREREKREREKKGGGGVGAWGIYALICFIRILEAQRLLSSTLFLMCEGSADRIWCFSRSGAFNVRSPEGRGLLAPTLPPRPPTSHCPPPTLTSLSRPEQQLEMQSKGEKKKQVHLLSVRFFMIYEHVRGRRLSVCIALQLGVLGEAKSPELFGATRQRCSAC